MIENYDEPIITPESAVRSEYQRIVAEYGNEGVTKDRALSDAVDIVMKRIDLGEVAEPSRRSALLKLGNDIDNRQGKAADKVIERLANGEGDLILDGDPFLDTVVTLGKGIRKTWRYITVEDLRMMADLRADNHRKVEEAERKFQRNVALVIATTAAYTTVGMAYEAGAFHAEAAA